MVEPQSFIIAWYRWLIVGSFVAFSFFALLTAAGAEREGPSPIILGGGLAGICLAIAFRGRRTSEIAIDDKGVKIFMVIRRKRIGWEEIASVQVCRASSMVAAEWWAPCFRLHTGKTIVVNDHRSKNPAVDFAPILEAIGEVVRRA